VIQSVLIFLLGFTGAAFLFLLIAPLIWRRAHYLWKKQVVAQLPLSLSAIEADRDLLRAAHAVALRKAEMQTRRLREKHTQALLQISADRAELAKLADVQGNHAQLQTAYQNQRQENSSLLAEIKMLQATLETRTEEAGHLKRQNEVRTQETQTLQQQMLERDGEIERLRHDASDLRHDKKQLNHEKAELASQVMVLKTTMESEKQRNKALEDRLQRLISELSDTQEKLTRHGVTTTSHSDDPHSSGLNAQDQKLRETMSDLAAEMVARTAAAEGSSSPIHALLGKDDEPSNKKGRKRKSLAQRIKKLST